MDRLRRAFSLVELLVVIAIMGVLLALLLPALQSVRESARTTQCHNNLKQLALALQNYHDVHHTFPPSVQFDSGEEPGQSDNYRKNWIILILPFLEEQTTFDRFDFSKPISDISNRPARGTSISTLRCPTDLGHDVLYAGLSGSQEGNNWARSNYAANGANAWLLARNWPGPYPPSPQCAHCGMPGVGPTAASGWADVRFRGVMGACVSVPLRKITDGSSHTMLLGEVRVGLSAHDPRGTWAMGAAGASALFGHGFGGDASGPNACDTSSDDLRACDAITADVGATVLQAECMTCYQSETKQVGLRSRHPGGVMTAFCDGSVHFILDLIYTGGAFAQTPSPWDHLITCCDGEQVSPQDWE
jgi:prepilin-type N-terminal cleavage/methylation domain-containing protein/prepilin-type processing-associated H-X9-DG protein